MTSIAYHQYCNISYNGGSYVCSPIKGPLSTSQTPGTIENKNRGITYAQNGQPVKDANCNNESSNSQDRRLFKEMVITVPGRLQQKLMGAYDASERSSLLRTIAVGTSGFNKANQALSFKNVHVQDSNRLLNKLRRVGGAVPPKVQAKILPASTSVANVRDNAHLQKQSKNSPNVKLSVFMPNHLRARIECTSGCDGGEIVIDNHNSSGNDAIISSEQATSYETLRGMNTFIVGTDSDGNNIILINTVSPILTNTRNISSVSKKYGLGKGRYLFSNVDKKDAFTILNHNKEDFIKIIGDEDKIFSKKVFGITYTFYYGDVIIDVIDNFGIMSIYTYKYEYAGAKYALVYGEHYTNTDVDEIIGFEKDGNNVQIEQDEETKTGLYFRFVNNELYPPANTLVRQHFGLGKGIYNVRNVPQAFAFTILNKGWENSIYMISEKPSSNSPNLIKNVDGTDYVFHYGDVTIFVNNDFYFMDLVSYSPNIKGEKHIFKYSSEFSNLSNSDIAPPSVESDDTTLPITLYGYNSAEYYTFDSTAIIIRPLTNADVSKFIRFSIEPDLPLWLTFNQKNGYITGYTINPDDAFYLKQYEVIAYLEDNTIKKYNLLIAMFNQESIVNSEFCNFSVFVKTPENEHLYNAVYPSNVPSKSHGDCITASILPKNIVINESNLNTVILNKYSCTNIWANSLAAENIWRYPLGLNINVKAPSGWNIYVGQFGFWALDQEGQQWADVSEPIKEVNTGKETITDFITFINNLLAAGSPYAGALTYPAISSTTYYTYRIYAKKN